ncbi:DEAD/DEAH box helicase family protein [Stigmatella erecta]|uniref:Superfamily II DNA or RNA helicase n=1 Tax=Stigmatella erecta TaxID=83460 RepID=A0A1I0AAW8_9BACT|nr:DEAD/DEAH box helicase family protein [Stigmatella erecta]SES91353.1 Superfamily II DNA or RNA helicase [Stigmatella erecta]
MTDASLPSSPFLALPPTAYIARNGLAFAIRDAYPVTPGHTLIIPFRHIATWFDATREEQNAILDLVDDIKRQLDSGVPHPGGTDRIPDGYNVGFNAGKAAGQAVMHLHVHVIPRYAGDVDDPHSSGVRHVIPEKGSYPRASADAPLAIGGESDPFARHVLRLFEQADEIAIIAAFVQQSGLRRIESALLRAIARGARVRLLTGDYLEITQAGALEQLLDWESALRVATDDEHGAPSALRGSLTTRIVETATLPGRTRAFHPKSWRFEHEHWGIAFVGSSNLSLSALDTGIEWNLGIYRKKEPETFARLCHAFEELWQNALPLSPAWISSYAERSRTQAPSLLPGEAEPEAFEPLPKPRDVQIEALAALRAARAAGRKRALVVLATGLGKTLLATLDYGQMREEIGHRPRLIFVAHRREILTQAATHYRRLAREYDPSLRIGWCTEGSDDLSADAVFASVSKLARAQMIERLHKQRFDYVVIDEVHHAAADSYRRILDALDAGFLLGLTATPERADDGDVFGLFDDFVAYRADISKGVSLGHLVPFAYHGVKDDIDYENIPWRNKRFDPEMLARAAQTEARMTALFRAWQAHPGTRTLVFCCSIEHAKFVRTWLRERGVRAEAVFTGPDSDERESALSKLRDGELDAVCSVDVFNEGVDVREIDRVVMLRPTESNVVFLQQLGRGLRAKEGKRSLTVIDFVGNHRIFLDRVRSLLSLTDASSSIERLRSFLQDGTLPELPAGCSVELELEAKLLLIRLFRVPAADAVERAYQELRLVRGERPTAGELLRSGHDPVHLIKHHRSWFEFVASQGDLMPEVAEVATRARTLLRDAEQTGMTKSFKMVLLDALLELDGLGPDGVALDALAARSWEVLTRSPELLAEVPDEDRPDGQLEGEKRWRAYWRLNLAEAWIVPKKTRQAELRLAGGRIFVDVDLRDAQRPVLASLLRELADYRHARYRRRLDAPEKGDAFTCKVLRNGSGDPILKLPPRDRGMIPEREHDVRLPDGAVWRFRFAKEFCNVARPPGVERNHLPDLMRSWFGPAAGAPGTSFQVRFSPSPDGLWVGPVTAQVIAFPGRRNAVAAYPDLRAAAGHAVVGHEDIEREFVALPLDNADDSLFAVRVAGDSMDGGNAPLRSGDWAVLRLVRGAAPSAVEGRIVLVEAPSEGVGVQYQLKRLLRREGAWRLVSDNPTGPSFPAREGMNVIARIERSFTPESLAPEVGTTIAEVDLARAFGLEELSARAGRYEGHLFGFIDRKGVLVSPTEVAMPGVNPRPGETAFVLALREPGTWRYLGVGRRQEDVREALFEIPEVDFETWRTLGEGRLASRTLPDEALSVAQRIVDALLSLPGSERVLTNAAGGLAFVRGRAVRGGLSIDGGPAGFKPRTVTLTDLAWVVVAARDIEVNGGVLDEARVNRFRYLEGTARGATRWIDTGWALAAYQAVSGRIGSLTAEPNPLYRVRDDGGNVLDASFRIERLNDQLTIIYESRGGTKGSASERNTQYAPGLEMLLARLAAMDAQITDVVVESGKTLELPIEQRKLAIEGESYPLRITDPVALRRKLGAAQAKVGRPEGAKGSGNSTRRIRLFLSGENLWRPGDWFARQLSGSRDTHE